MDLELGDYFELEPTEYSYVYVFNNSTSGDPKNFSIRYKASAIAGYAISTAASLAVLS